MNDELHIISFLFSNVSKEVKTALDELVADETQYVPQREADELFNLVNGVQIFFVSSDGRVSTFSEPSSLRIFCFKEKQGEEEWNPVFIQVNGWTHPLIPGASPALEAANGAIMFPDVYADQSGSAIGLVLADDVPQEAREQLHKLLEEYTMLKSEEKLPRDQQLGTIGKALVKGAELLCKGMEYGSEKAVVLIEYAGEQQKAKMGDAAQSDKKVGPALKYSAKGAYYATHATVKVSGFVANRVGKLTKGLANYLGAQVAKPVTGTVTGVTGGSSTKSPSMQNLVDAARGGLYAYATVYNGLESSAKVLGGSIKNNSVNVVQHKYGEEAGEVFSDSMTAAGNAAMTYMNVQSLGVKGLIKKTAKNTGKAVGKAVIDAHVKPKDTQ